LDNQGIVARLPAGGARDIFLVKNDQTGCAA